MTLVTIISAIALGFGALFGLACFISPEYASRSVRLKADPERHGGYAEFRATFGGVFAGLHLAALAFLLASPTGGPAAAAAIAAGWAGAAIGRITAIVLDTAKVKNTSMNWKLIPLEVVMTLAIAAPLLQGWMSS